MEKSSLTGEALPVTVGTHAHVTDRLHEASNMVFHTTKCIEGECFGVVVATGDRALIGKIASLASATTTELTPIQKEIKHFVVRLAVVALILGCIFLVISIIRGASWIDAVINTFVVVVIACVPEGLPVTIVSCLAVTAKRMAKRHVRLGYIYLYM